MIGFQCKNKTVTFYFCEHFFETTSLENLFYHLCKGFTWHTQSGKMLPFLIVLISLHRILRTGRPPRRRLEHQNELFFTSWLLCIIPGSSAYLYVLTRILLPHLHYLPCHLFNFIVTVIKTGWPRIHWKSFLR